MGAAQLARLLSSQQDRAPPSPGERAGRPPTAALADGVRLLVLEGRVPVAARLPAERELAAAFGVSRTTVAAAYEALRAEGFLESRRGAGSWTAVPAGNPLPTRGLEPLPPEAAGSMIDLGCAALPAPEPWLTRAVQGALAELPPYAHTHGDYPAGLPVLRQALADRYTARGIPTMPEQIMVTTGAMGAVAAICRLCRGPRRAGRRRVPVLRQHPPADAGRRRPARARWRWPRGWPAGTCPSGGRCCATRRPGMAYVVADFHNPTGALATEDQRRRLVDAARSAGTRARRRRDDDRTPAGRRTPNCPAPSARSTRRAARSSPSARRARRSGPGCGSAGCAPRRTSSAAWSPPAPTPTSAHRCSNSSPSPGCWRPAAGSRPSRSAATRPARTATRSSRRCAGTCPTGSSAFPAAG